MAKHTNLKCRGAGVGLRLRSENRGRKENGRKLNYSEWRNALHKSIASWQLISLEEGHNSKFKDIFLFQRNSRLFTLRYSLNVVYFKETAFTFA